METLMKLRDFVGGFLSPAKRRRTLDAATSGGKAMRLTEPASVPKDFRPQGVRSGRVSKRSRRDARRTGRPPAVLEKGDRRKVSTYFLRDAGDENKGSHDETMDTTEANHAAENDSREEDGMRVSSLYEIVASDSISQRPFDSPSQDKSSASEDRDDQSLYASENEDEGSQLSPESKVRLFLDRQTELALKQEVIDFKEGDWHPDEIQLFERLQERGRVPMLPLDWAYDFRSFPARLFSDEDGVTVINSRSGNYFYAAKALALLCAMGGKARDLILFQVPSEPRMKKEIDAYVKWSERDGGYFRKRFVPHLCVIRGSQRRGHEALNKAAEDQMAFLALKHRRALAHPAPGHVNERGEVEIYVRRPPLVYGIVISKCITIFVTLDAADPDAKLRTIAHFDFSQRRLDVWNGAAIAILICTVRDKIMEHIDTLVDDDDYVHESDE